jgi:hypothetical protein
MTEIEGSLILAAPNIRSEGRRYARRAVPLSTAKVHIKRASSAFPIYECTG